MKDKNKSKEIKKYPEIGRLYEHYKGGKYEVITLCKNSETDEDLVIYKSIHFGSVHARPLSMWFDKINLLEITNGRRGGTVYRFELLTEQ